MDKQNAIYPYSGRLFSNKKEPSVDIFYNMNKLHKH